MNSASIVFSKVLNRLFARLDTIRFLTIQARVLAKNDLPKTSVCIKLEDSWQRN